MKCGMRQVLSRREFLRTVGVGCVAAAGGLTTGRSVAAVPFRKVIPSAGEPLPVIGMGTWIAFNVGPSAELRVARTEVMRAFL